MNRRRLAALLLAPALSLTACGGGGDGKSDSSSSSAPNPEVSVGITVPSSPGGSGGPGGGGGSAGGGTGGSGTPGGAAPSSAPTKVVNDFVACMRAHGVKVPDDVSHWQPTPGPGDTHMQAALLACMKSAGAK
ncbi:hypothetical protein [Actinomadura montaniterrae]|uniref:hypothetical protein n=1 Tax=Actinomadura montaniterrae TaxID=1803903 RepID=UPI00178C6684|nr:hypothetical protein [Actinomadura montaniterrae]